MKEELQRPGTEPIKVNVSFPGVVMTLSIQPKLVWMILSTLVVGKIIFVFRLF